MDLDIMPPSLDHALELALRSTLATSRLLGANINGIYDSAPVQAHAPYITIGDAVVSDWSAKAFDGQDIRLAITLHDDRRSRERCARLGDALTAAIGEMDEAVEGGRIVLKQMQRLRVGRSGETGWMLVTDWRFLVERSDSF